MPRITNHNNIDFEQLNPSQQESILRVRQAIIDVALRTYQLREAPMEVIRRNAYAGECLGILFGKKVTDNPVELLKQTGMSEEEIQAAGVTSDI